MFLFFMIFFHVMHYMHRRGKRKCVVRQLTRTNASKQRKLTQRNHNINNNDRRDHRVSITIKDFFFIRPMAQ